MRVKILHIVLLVFLFSQNTLAQNYSNEWIDYNKQYFKITTAQDGVYRIGYADLINAGFPVSSVDPRRIQLFHRGIEQAIVVNGQGDAVFNTTDFISFYGKRNDGTLDAKLYEPASAQPHNFYNLYSDSTAYFLTYNLTPINGKRMQSYSENNVEGLPAETYHNREILLLNNNNYSAGRSFGATDETEYTFFDIGEGWTSSLFQEGEFMDNTLVDITNRYTSEVKPQLEVLLVGRDNVDHETEIFVGASTASLRSVGIINYSDYENAKFNSEIEWSDINSSGELLVRVTANSVNGANDRISVSYVRLIYPEEWNANLLTTKRFELKSNTGNKSFINVSNVASGSKLYDITDSNTVIEIGFNSSGSTIEAIINNTITSRDLLITSEDLVPVIQPVSFRNITPSMHDYVIISNKILHQSTADISDPIRAYADYRASADGGSFDTLSVDMDLLYNQFNYGEVSPLAIKNFMRFMVDQGSPSYLFLIGKGIDPRYNFHRNPTGFVEVTKLGITRKIRDLVPSAGNPGADILFTSGLNGTTYEPAVATGRLPAVNSEQVVAYLNKVKEMDNLPFDNLWRKKVLQLSGGISTFELSQFRNYMNGFATTAEGDYLGGEVIQVNKQSNSTVELINVADEVNAGVNLITFFGHSSPSVIDIDIGFVTDPVLGYNNVGRYPMFLINGCNAGQFFNQNVLFGEDWMLAANKGAVGFIAHSSSGFSNNLRDYTDTFYSIAYGDSTFINKPIGDIHKETARRYISQKAETPDNITQAQQMVMLADPAISLFGAKNPDFEINENNAFAESFNDQPINAASDSFAIKLIVRNFGITTMDSLSVQITRTYSDNTSITYDSIYPSVHFQDTLIFSINNQTDNNSGNNKFLIQLDAGNSIEELNEGNNSVLIDVFVPLFGTKNLFPINYAIVNQHDVSLMSQSSNIFGNDRAYLFEIDTVDTFNSPFKQQTSVTSKILSTWSPSLLANDSVVYFWRTKFAQPLKGESNDWVQSSFIYINNGPEGWSQSVFDQYNDNVLTGLSRNEINLSLDFKKNQTSLFVKTFGSNNPATIEDVSIKLNNIEYNINNLKRCRDNTVNFIAFRKTTSVPYAAIPLGFIDVRTCGRTPQVINSYRINEFESGSDDLIDYINAIDEGDSVVMYTIGNPQFSNWSVTVLNKLEEIGLSSSELSALQDGQPLILKGKKGTQPGDASIYTSSTDPKDEQELSLESQVSGVFSSGQMNSVLIGPASSWQNVITSVLISETPQTDEFGIDILGINQNGNESILFDDQPGGIIDISSTDAIQYPYLRLVYNTEDSENLTASQLKKWQVLYTGVPEGLLFAADDFVMREEKQEGDNIEFSLNFMNFSDKNFSDSLIVNYDIFNRDNRTTQKLSKKIKSPLIGDTTRFKLSVQSRGKVGKNDLNVFVNPSIEAEQYYENNLLDINEYLNVIKDDIHPILDVVFDGEHILDGEIVSPSPLIGIVLKDENLFLQKSDTTGVDLFIKQSCETCNFERIPFSSSNIQWFAASDNEDFKIEYKPNPLENGIYTLRVEASDETGNKSGVEPYTINFEVINESTITNFYPYPNPFSTSTRFIFTLTGSEIPNEIKIQIMTVSGRIVREITQNELGPIRIGNNITNYAWNGRDEYGDQLANGVYIYRVIVKSNGHTLDSRSTSGDKAFKKGYGKLYLLK